MTLAHHGQPSLLRPFCGCSWLRLVRGLTLVAAVLLPWVEYFGMVVMILALSGPSDAILASRLLMLSVEGCFGWIDRSGYVGA